MEAAERRLRQEIIDVCLKMSDVGINQGTSGNVSVRHGDGILITPSGIAYEQLVPEDIVAMDFDGTATGKYAASSEWRFHLDILKARPDLNAVVHAHPIYSTAIAMCREEIPAVHYMIAGAGGPTIRCAPYATYGTKELSDHALAALDGRNACLLANHGLIAGGPSLAKALWLAVEIETLAHQLTVARQFGNPVVLGDDEIAVVVEKFKNYGLKEKD
ncbi:class II aldolase/adducin family protein [Rhodobium gokarnense]|uniref:L-fuculose-phosphate aldolase n=1 Tax=Rhodobium gokarnense TaxID=364296 RepID=A0ABT3HIV6_9HYPH|nr:class II aldolase/adducin family protein [Rhodobium gokarnense]MCW2310234.1 L-fuculose-phosphate aldolase [Rhodobium gokarnense]